MTTRASAKARGSRWEREVVDFMRPVWPDCERAPRWGSADKGDLVATGPFVVEAKACKSIDLASFVDEAVRETVHAGRTYPVVFVKRRNRQPNDAYVVMPAWAFRLLLSCLP